MSTPPERGPFELPPIPEEWERSGTGKLLPDAPGVPVSFLGPDIIEAFIEAISEITGDVADSLTDELLALARANKEADFRALASCSVAPELVDELWTRLRARLGR